MPLFDYRCVECGHEFEALQAINEPALADCPKCDMVALQKLLSAPHFSFGDEDSARKQLMKEEVKKRESKRKKEALTSRRADIHIK